MRGCVPRAATPLRRVLQTWCHRRLPPHERYCEPFLGGGAIMLLKKPARVNVGLDLDPEALKTFRGLVASSDLASAVQLRSRITGS
jgi:site-specific DNA-adenine methylase